MQPTIDLALPIQEKYIIKLSNAYCIHALILLSSFWGVFNSMDCLMLTAFTLLSYCLLFGVERSATPKRMTIFIIIHREGYTIISSSAFSFFHECHREGYMAFS